MLCLCWYRVTEGVWGAANGQKSLVSIFKNIKQKKEKRGKWQYTSCTDENCNWDQIKTGMQEKTGLLQSTFSICFIYSYPASLKQLRKVTPNLSICPIFRHKMKSKKWTAFCSLLVKLKQTSKRESDWCLTSQLGRFLFVAWFLNKLTTEISQKNNLNSWPNNKRENRENLCDWVLCHSAWLSW